MKRARPADLEKADLEIAARCELALRGILHPTPEQEAGAILRAFTAHDLRRLVEGKSS